MTVSVTIEGMDDLRAKFAALSDKQQRGVLRTAIRAGAQLVVREARKNVHDDTGNLRKGIKAKVAVKTGGAAEADIGWDYKIAPHGHLVELGHVQVVGPRGKGKGRTVGHVPPHPFLRPALMDNEARVLDVIEKNLRKNIEKIAAGQTPVVSNATEAA